MFYWFTDHKIWIGSDQVYSRPWDYAQRSNRFDQLQHSSYAVPKRSKQTLLSVTLKYQLSMWCTQSLSELISNTCSPQKCLIIQYWNLLNEKKLGVARILLINMSLQLSLSTSTLKHHGQNIPVRQEWARLHSDGRGGMEYIRLFPVRESSGHLVPLFL